MNTSRLLCIIISMVLFLGVYGPTVIAESSISVVIEGVVQKYDQQPVIKSGMTLVPLRGIFESLGATVTWNGQTKSITGFKGDTTINLIVGSNTAIINNEPIKLALAAQIINGRTFVPLRFVSESLGAKVGWESSSRTIYIESGIETSAAPILVDRKLYEPHEISELVSSAIIYIELYDKEGKVLSSGSGFIVESSGKIVTNYHVIDGAHSGKIRLIDGTEYKIEYILGYDEARDIAVLKINGSNFPTVILGNSDKVVNGEKILAIGSPFGLENTISDGLVSNRNRFIDDYRYIQVSAPISPGSSGGALLNYYGEVIGITTASHVSGQNLNLAVPINDLTTLNLNVKLSLADVYEQKHMIYYSDAIYEGEIDNGVPEGYGTLTYSNGDKYVGEFVEGYFHGVGTYEWSVGDTYIGSWIKGNRTGYGLYTWPNGAKYEGDFLNGEREGYGIYTYPDGSTLKGKWKNGQFVN
jgi:serine protease Do